MPIPNQSAIGVGFFIGSSAYKKYAYVVSSSPP